MKGFVWLKYACAWYLICCYNKLYNYYKCIKSVKIIYSIVDYEGFGQDKFRKNLCLTIKLYCSNVLLITLQLYLIFYNNV